MNSSPRDAARSVHHDMERARRVLAHLRVFLIREAGSYQAAFPPDYLRRFYYAGAGTSLSDLRQTYVHIQDRLREQRTTQRKTAPLWRDAQKQKTLEAFKAHLKKVRPSLKSSYYTVEFTLNPEEDAFSSDPPLFKISYAWKLPLQWEGFFPNHVLLSLRWIGNQSECARVVVGRFTPRDQLVTKKLYLAKDSITGALYMAPTLLGAQKKMNDARATRIMDVL